MMTSSPTHIVQEDGSATGSEFSTCGDITTLDVNPIYNQDLSPSFSPRVHEQQQLNRSIEEMGDCAMLMEGHSETLVDNFGLEGLNFWAPLLGETDRDSMGFSLSTDTDAIGEDELMDTINFDSVLSCRKDPIKDKSPKPWMKSAGIPPSTAEYVVNAQGLFGNGLMGWDSQQNFSELMMAHEYIEQDSRKSEALNVAQGFPATYTAACPWIPTQGSSADGFGYPQICPSIEYAPAGLPAAGHYHTEKLRT